MIDKYQDQSVLSGVEAQKLLNTVPLNLQVKTFIMNSVPALEELTGYTFKNHRFVIEAFTHESLGRIPNYTTGSYQRLEWLGDRVLNMIISERLYKQLPDSDPGRLTNASQYLVNNDILAKIGWHYGLHTHLLHRCSSIPNQLEVICDNIHENVHHPMPRDRRDPIIPRVVELHKLFADLFESLLAAIYEDSGYDLSVVKPILWRLCTLEVVKRRRPGEIYRLMVNEKKNTNTPNI